VLRALISRALLLAPFDGAVSERYLDPGAVVQPGTRVLRVVRQGPLRVRFRLTQREVSRVSVGSPIQVTTQSNGAREF